MLTHRRCGVIRRVTMVLLPALLGVACATAGSSWMAEPLVTSDDETTAGSVQPDDPDAPRSGVQRKTIGAEPDDEPEAPLPPASASASSAVLEGRVLGKFRNTYYDFPEEKDFSGASVALKSAKCETLKDVPRPFFEQLCVQGSGVLATGQTVSFAKRGCKCAEVCPKTEQKICYDALDPVKFPFGRGATGRAITPLHTVAVDTKVIPLGTPIYIPEMDGLPRDEARSAAHDGCFLAEDRGMKVKGEHVDVFTGTRAMTALWNQAMPSNHGVTVVLDSPRCVRPAINASRAD